VAHEVGALCPDESALHIAQSRAIVLADGVVRGGPQGQTGPLSFVPDALMDDPPDTKRHLLDAYAELVQDLGFEHILLAHGGPLVGDGRAQLQEFLKSGGRTAFQL
jgi:hypothetical protein